MDDAHGCRIHTVTINSQWSRELPDFNGVKVAVRLGRVFPFHTFDEQRDGYRIQCCS
jgi:hypothetical protein